MWCFNHESEDAANETSASLLDIPVSDKINQILIHSRRLLHYKEIEELVFKKYGHRHSASTYLNKSPDVIKLLPGVFIHEDQYNESIKKAFIIQKAAVVKWVAKQVKSKNIPLDVQVVAALLYQSGKIRYFSEKSIESLVVYTAQIDPEIIIVPSPSDSKKRSLTKKDSNNNRQTPETSENVIIETVKVNEKKTVDTNNKPHSQLQTSVYETFSEPPDEVSLKSLPIFYSKKLNNVSIDDLHKNYKAHTLLSDMVLSARTSKALRASGMTKIGEVMLTPAKDTLKYKNFGKKSLKELEDIIKHLVLTEEFNPNIILNDSLDENFCIEYLSYKTLVSSFTKFCIKSQRDQKLITKRLYFHTAKKPTLVHLGNKFDITRERTRQIIKKGFGLMQNKANLDILNDFWDQVEQIIVNGGGVVNLGELAVALQNNYKWSETPNPIALGQLLNLHQPKLNLTGADALIEIDCECLTCDHPSKRFHSLDFEANDSFHVQVLNLKLTKYCQENCTATPVQNFNRAFIDRLIDQTDGQYVIQDDIVLTRNRWLLRYSTDREATMKAVLEKHGHPMHFSAIAKSLRKESLHFSDISKRNTHAALQHYDDFVLIELGTYGLKSWHLSPYRSVSDAIEELLDQSELPLRKTEIIQCLAGEFNEGNVSAALSNRTALFVGIGEGFYDLLRKWRKRSCSDFIDRLPPHTADFTRYLISR
ncbi:DNA-directed RNA polymerase subunit alpha C-terminal domain-containing protein, partial [Desulfococcaceae bacterium HSG7]|nr:DNA-directed RNA polymerase subunit alpha C-terminal domain-containing protein [Desulfococcaceae bacterium HSG7]